MSGRIRYMRLIVFFDLPVQTPRQRKSYARFRHFLEKNGYLMMQESVYSKLALTDRIAAGLVLKLKENRPPEGLVQVLKITERQYSTIDCIVGAARKGFELEDTSSLVVL